MLRNDILMFFEISREKGDFLKTTIGHWGLNGGSNCKRIPDWLNLRVHNRPTRVIWECHNLAENLVDSWNPLSKQRTFPSEAIFTNRMRQSKRLVNMPRIKFVSKFILKMKIPKVCLFTMIQRKPKPIVPSFFSCIGFSKKWLPENPAA